MIYIAEIKFIILHYFYANFIKSKYKVISDSNVIRVAI